MNRFESMSLFVSVVEASSFSGCSRKLGIPLPTVSRKITELELHLGVRLFNRTTRSLELTDVGRTYLTSCKRILEDLSETERATSGEYSTPKGDLVVTAPIVFGRVHMLPLLSEFLKAYPEINIRFYLADRVLHLLEEHVDLALRIGELPDSSLMGVQVGNVRKVTCASPAYLAARKAPKNPKELSTHECITNTTLDDTAHWDYFQNGKSKFPVSIRSRLSVTTAESCVDSAVAGVGITRVLSYQSQNAVSTGKLKLILEDYEPSPFPVHVVYSGGRALPLKLRSLRDFVVPRLKEILLSNTRTERKSGTR